MSIKPVAVITGAGGGMGAACARRLANTHTLILTDFNSARLDATAFALREEENADISATICGDIADDAVVSQIVQAADTAGGGCKALIHTAGLSPALAPWQPIITTNLVGTEKLLAAFEALLTPGFVGVVLSSTARLYVPPAGEALASLLARPLASDLLKQLEPQLGDGEATRATNAYAYTKAWVCNTVQQRATRWASHGARIVSLSPGFIRTAMTIKEVEDRPEMRALLDSTPVSRWGTVSDIVNLVEFILSDKASFITGTDIVIDGGLSARLLTQPRA
ncbi:MAG: SDR family oxidoreductase [Georgfuchsia sp.]